MLGLAILFFLGLWVIITIIAMVIGSKFGRKPATKLLGAFLGFMLTMGGLIVYWTIEYIQIQRTVTRLCETEGGIKVYVTPEEWREQIGEDEWKKSFYTGEKASNYPKDSFIKLENKEYHPISQINHRIIRYSSDDYGKKGYIFNQDMLFYDVNLKKILYHERVFSASGAPPLHRSLEAFKFWLDYGIHDCNYNKSQFLNKYQYSSSKK